MYTLANVTKDYQKGCGTVHALAGVDLVLEDRAWLAIQGPTGHGKSTLLQILPCAITADSFASSRFCHASSVMR